MYSRKSVHSYPMVRADGLLVEEVGDETVVYDTQSKEAHCLKPLAAQVFALGDGHTTVAEIAAKAGHNLGQAVTEGDVADAVRQLEQSRLLEMPLAIHDGLSRREMVRKVGFAGAAIAGATPLITSIVAPTAAMAASGIATGCSGCGKNSDCVSNHCCQSNAGKSCNEGCCVELNNSCHACPVLCGGAGQPPCTCTVLASTIPGGCPCVCGTAGCVNVPCCPTLTKVCCVQQSPC
jgi:hypothetical protein